MNLDTIFLLIQTILIGGAAGLTWYLYIKAKNDDLRSRATMIYYQIKDIENNIEYVKKNCYKENLLISHEFYKSNLIYNKNLWDESKTYLVKKMSTDTYNKVERFYSEATVLLNEQIAVKKTYEGLLTAKQEVYYKKQLEINIGNAFDGQKNGDAKVIMDKIQSENQLLDIAIDFTLKDFVPGISKGIIQNVLYYYVPLTDTIAYEKIKIIAKINN